MKTVRERKQTESSDMKPCKMRQLVTGKCLLEWLDPHREFQSHTSET